MEKKDVVEQIVAAWNVHNTITQYLIAKIPAKGLDAVPLGSRGRTVREQFIHMNRVRLGWLVYHTTGKRVRPPRPDSAQMTKRELQKSFRASGLAVESFLRDALEGKIFPKAFRKQAVRWMGYLISHESHHRGQIMLALKQQGMRMPESVSLHGLWGKWMWGS